MDLTSEILEAERKARREGPCPLCQYIDTLEGEERELMVRAAEGTIGVNALVSIMQKHKTGIGRRTIESHRQEGHKP